MKNVILSLIAFCVIILIGVGVVFFMKNKKTTPCALEDKIKSLANINGSWNLTTPPDCLLAQFEGDDNANIKCFTAVKSDKDMCDCINKINFDGCEATLKSGVKSYVNCGCYGGKTLGK